MRRVPQAEIVEDAITGKNASDNVVLVLRGNSSGLALEIQRHFPARRVDVIQHDPSRSRGVLARPPRPQGTSSVTALGRGGLL